MNKSKLKILYLICLFLFISIMSNRTYNIGELTFLIPAIVSAFVIGVAGVFLWGKNMKLHKNLYFISYAATVGFTFIPWIGVYIQDGNHSYGFPAQWFDFYYASGRVSINLLAFLFNFFILYFTLRLIKKLWLNISKKELIPK